LFAQLLRFRKMASADETQKPKMMTADDCHRFQVSKLRYCCYHFFYYYCYYCYHCYCISCYICTAILRSCYAMLSYPMLSYPMLSYSILCYAMLKHRYANPQVTKRPELNKGTSFTDAERAAHGIRGLFPAGEPLSLDLKVEVAMTQLRSKATPLDRYIFLHTIQVLCYAVLCCVVLCYAMLCCVMLCYAMLCYAVLCYAMLCCAMLCYAVLCYAVLCYAVLCCAMLCCAMLCYAMLLCYANDTSAYTPCRTLTRRCTTPSTTNI
jgi:hypothetical protein